MDWTFLEVYVTTGVDWNAVTVPIVPIKVEWEVEAYC